MVTVVLGICVDSATSERARNLATSLTAMRQQTLSRDLYRIVLVEQGTAPRLDAAVADTVDDYVFAYSAGPFNRSWVLNIGAMRAAEGVVCTFDADLVVPPNFLRRGLLGWQCGARAIKPFKSVLYMDAESTQRVHEQMRAGAAIDCDDPRHRGAVHPWSKGGCIWIDARLYRDLGGHDERFEGWGDEDREFWGRLTQRTPIVTLDGRLLHLYHARAFEQEPEVRANRVLWRGRQHDFLPAPRTRIVGDVNRYRRNGDARSNGRRSATAARTVGGAARHERLREALLEEATAICRGQPTRNGWQPERFHLRGLLAARDGNDTVALTCLTRAVELDPSASDCWLDLGRLYLRTGRTADAIGAQLRAIALAPEHPSAYQELGRVLHRVHRHAEATLACQEALLLDLGNTQILGELADVLCDAGRLDQALAASEVAQRLEPDDVQSHLRLGRVRLARKEWDLALVAFRQARLLAEGPRGMPGSTNGGPNPGKDRWLIDARSWAPVAAKQRSAGEEVVDPDCVAVEIGAGDAHARLGASEEAAASYAAASKLAPKDASAARRLAVTLEALGRHQDAVGAWVTLGGALEATQRLKEAMAAYRQAVASKPDGLKAWTQLGRVHLARGEYADAIQCFDRALQIDPDHPLAHTERGRASYTADDVEAGWREFAWWCRPLRVQARSFEQPVWDGSPLEGRTILAWADQELGDTIHWLQYVPALAQLGARVVVECQPRLVPLVRTVEGIDLVVGQHAPLPAFDVHVPLTLIPSVSEACRSHRCRAPYFRADRALVDVWRQRLAGRGNGATRTVSEDNVAASLKVGLCWAGHPNGINAAYRFARLTEFGALRGLADVRFVSLQMGPQAAEILNPPQGLRVEHLQDDTCTTADTAALMENLDLVITIDTMVAHLAGALGRPVWLVLPSAADWRWGRDPHESPLYPTMRVFRQARPGDWAGVFERVRSALCCKRPPIRSQEARRWKALPNTGSPS